MEFEGDAGAKTVIWREVHLFDTDPQGVNGGH